MRTSSWYWKEAGSHATQPGDTPGVALPEQIPASRWPTPHALAVTHVAHTVSFIAVASSVWYSVPLHSRAVLHVSWPAW